MGCDIHCHIEVKIGGRWEHYSAPSIMRSYRLFGRMAGVRRDDIMPIAKPRGVPPDMSLITEIAYHEDGTDAHTHSWLTGAELDQLCSDLDKEGGGEYSTNHGFGFLFGGGFTVEPGSTPDVVTDCRLVFWFDN